MTDIVVTGSAGYVGRHVVARLAASGNRVRALVHRRAADLPAGVDAVKADITRPETLLSAVEGASTLIHCAAITGDRKESRRGLYDVVNRVGTENVVAAARAAGVRRIVQVSGLGTAPAPAGTYMATRWAAEEAVRGGGVAFVILQPSVLFGDGAPFVTALANLVRTSPVVPVIGSGSLLFQPLHVDDLARCVEISCSEPSVLGRAHPLGGPEQLTFREILATIAAALRKRRLIVPVPLRLARVQARVMAALLPNPPLTPAAIELFSFDNATEIDAVSRTFGFQPRAFREQLLARGVDG